jgi:TPR repeat protein
MSYLEERFLLKQISILVTSSIIWISPHLEAQSLQVNKRKAKQGDAIAQNQLGIAYAIGEGVPQNFTTALKWFRLAAEKGYVEAQYNLGIFYLNGEAIEEDYVLAYMWLTLAGEQGNEGAKKNLKFISDHMSADQIAQSEKLVLEWKSKKKKLPK